ncbi:MAG TPA: hypothetical protein VKU36_03935 [Candidatus Babeliales bacterium]|nr:hypothetical protein [Candidatus Babeliales bacterium]
MKKYLLFLSLGIITTATDSLAMMGMMRKVFKSYTTQPTVDNLTILVTKQSQTKIQEIAQDYNTISNLITHTSKKLNLYKKPSDLINALSQDKSIRTTKMSPSMAFFQHDTEFLDQYFEQLSAKYNASYAWENVLPLIQAKLTSTTYYFTHREFVHNAALVSLKQEQQLPKSFAIWNACEGDNIVSFNTKHWSQKQRSEIIEEIQHYKNLVSKE